RSYVVTNAMTVGLPRIAVDVTGRASSESYTKLTAPSGSLASAWLVPTGSIAGSRLPPHATRGISSVLPIALLTHECIATVREEDVERRERAIALGDVLLDLHLLVVGQLARVYLLLEDAQLVANHDDLMEKRVDRDALFLRPLLAGLDDDLAAFEA